MSILPLFSTSTLHLDFLLLAVMHQLKLGAVMHHPRASLIGNLFPKYPVMGVSGGVSGDGGMVERGWGSEERRNSPLHMPGERYQWFGGSQLSAETWPRNRNSIRLDDLARLKVCVSPGKMVTEWRAVGERSTTACYI